MPLIDIREYKAEMRTRYKNFRRQIDPQRKAQKDAKIAQRIRALGEYKHSNTVLCYVSTEQEVDTRALINQALADKKIVAVPYCIPGTREMDFYRIKSLDELVPRTFGVLEPVAETSEKVTNFKNAICILPGLAFDTAGFRLGYGGGYYDRFLSTAFTGISIGICYSECVVGIIRHGRYDVPCKLLVTDSFVRHIKNRQPPKGG